jgi:CHASE2 domain-containing sensor protein/signal transduction histidine kinase
MDKSNETATWHQAAWRHPVVREWLVIALLLSCFVLFALRGEWFSRIEFTVYDQALSMWKRPAQSDIVIIGIDEESVKQVGRWPWARSLHATLLDKLTAAQPKAIALDIILSESDKRDPRQDEILAKSIRDNGRVVLPVAKLFDDGLIAGDAPPVEILSQAANRLAVVSSHIESDGVTRKAFLRGGFRDQYHDLLALATLRLAEPDRVMTLESERAPPSKTPDGVAVWTMTDPYVIPFAGPPGHFKKISYIDVLRGDVPLATFTGKIVMVGMTAAGTGDEFPTPVSGLSRLMPGIEIHANILQGLREGIDIKLASLLVTGTLSVLLVIVLLASYLWLPPGKSIALTAALCVLAFVASLIVFRYASVWISPVVALIAMVLAYPLWSWRKLEATQRYFDDELKRLQAERSVVSIDAVRTMSPQAALNAFVPDVVEQRIAAVRDATEQLRTLNRFVADSLESLPEAALVTDVNYRVALANSSADRLFAIARAARAGGSLQGLDVFELLRDYKNESGTSWRELWTKALAEKRVLSLEAGNNDDQEFLVQMAPSVSQSGVLAGTVITLSDISPLRESERRRDEALRFLSHDMRSPQASILTLLEMQREDPTSMPQDKLVERIGRYAKRTLTLADDFLRLAKAERSRPQDFRPLELVSLLQDAVEEGWSLAQGKSIRVVSDVPDDEAWVMGERDLLTRVLMNLLSNAIKYSPPKTTVTCRLESRDDLWALGVADQGYGITEADMSRLFSRFVRLHQEGQPEEEGIGLGLVFVKTVVTRHNGEIAVTSKARSEGHADHGTTFTITLPKVEPPKD